MAAKKHVKKPAKPTALSPDTLRKYAAEYTRIAGDLEDAIHFASVRSDVEPRHVVVRVARCLDKAERILLALRAEDREGPWRSLTGDAFPGGGREFWTYCGVKWLREQKPLCFDMRGPEFDPSAIRTDAEGRLNETDMLVMEREQIADHRAACLALAEILSDEIGRRGADKGAGLSGKKAKGKPRKGLLPKVFCPQCGRPMRHYCTGRTKRYYRCEHGCGKKEVRSRD